MAYATKQDIIDLYGEAALFAADRDGDAVVEDVAIDTALAAASSEIDGYLATRYELPLDTAPQQLIRPCVDIAIYRLAKDAATRSDEDRLRYEDAVAYLGSISAGRVDLVLPPSATPGDFDKPSPIVTSGPPRIFSREETEGL